MTWHDLDTSTRGGATKAALLERSASLFAERGYDAVSTREIANAAGANVAAIAYHFGGKDELYREVVRLKSIKLNSFYEECNRRIRAEAADAAGDMEKMRELSRLFVETFLRTILDPWVDEDGVQADICESLLFSREMQAPTAHFHHIWDNFLNHLFDAAEHLAAAGLGVPRESRECILTGQAVCGMLSGFLFNRYALFRRMDWDDYEQAEEIIEVCNTLVLRMLNLSTMENK